MDVDGKSEDELELERLVFGDIRGIQERLKGNEETLQKTDLEHLENDQAGVLCSAPSHDSYSSSMREITQMKWEI
jgi:hypothetical protein